MFVGLFTAINLRCLGYYINNFRYTLTEIYLKIASRFTSSGGKLLDVRVSTSTIFLEV